MYRKIIKAKPDKLSGWRSPLVSALVAGMIWGISAVAIAQPQPSQPPVEPPLDLAPLEPGAAIANSNVVVGTNISQYGLSIPSLWWAREQFGGKLVDNWLAYPGDKQTPGRVDIIVNRQLWSLQDYLDRYEFVHHFGQVAKDFGYNIRVFNRQKILLAAYTCNFSDTPVECSMWLDSTGLVSEPNTLLGK